MIKKRLGGSIFMETFSGSQSTSLCQLRLLVLAPSFLPCKYEQNFPFFFPDHFLAVFIGNLVILTLRFFFSFFVSVQYLSLYLLLLAFSIHTTVEHCLLPWLSYMLLHLGSQGILQPLSIASQKEQTGYVVMSFSFKLPDQRQALYPFFQTCCLVYFVSDLHTSRYLL